MSIKNFNCQNLKQLAEIITSQNIFGLIVQHPIHGRAAVLEYDNYSKIYTLWFESQQPGFNGFRNILYSFEEYIIVTDTDFEKQARAMMSFLNS